MRPDYPSRYTEPQRVSANLRLRRPLYRERKGDLERMVEKEKPHSWCKRLLSGACRLPRVRGDITVPRLSEERNPYRGVIADTFLPDYMVPAETTLLFLFRLVQVESRPGMFSLGASKGRRRNTPKDCCTFYSSRFEAGVDVRRAISRIFRISSAIPGECVANCIELGLVDAIEAAIVPRNN